MIFFWTIFDGIISYATPILITQRGYSNSAMGLIIAFSSVAGAVFDLFLSKLLKNSNYLKIFLLILAISFTYPFFLWSSTGLALFLLTMCLWGLYYDLYTFALYDFLSHHSQDQQNTLGISVISAFRSVALLVAPIIAGLLITDIVDFSNLAFSLMFLFLAAIFFVLLFAHSPLHHQSGSVSHHRSRNIKNEIELWRRIGHILWPVLLFNILTYMFDATFWTIGPLFASVFPAFEDFSGLLMALYSLPSIFVIWYLKPLVKKFGKKHTAYFSFLLANLFLIPIGWIQLPWLILIFIFLASIASALTFPAIDSAYVDYVSESGSYATEIEGLNDFSTNLGYIFGPIFAGVISDRFGIASSFTLLGIVNILLVLILFKITPRHINVVLHHPNPGLVK